MDAMARRAKIEEIENRVANANLLIDLIASHGRRFFEFIHNDGRHVARLKRNDSGHLFLWNEWSRKWIYVSRYGVWRGFHHGGTLHSLVGQLVQYIKTGKQLRASWFDGKHWGYDSEMQIVVNAGVKCGVIAGKESM